MGWGPVRDFGKESSHWFSSAWRPNIGGCRSLPIKWLSDRAGVLSSSAPCDLLASETSPADQAFLDACESWIKAAAS
jgi:hypothetical protein